VQALNPEALRRVAATAAKKIIKADKEQIAAEAQAVRERVTTGIYKYAPVKFGFEVKNGTLRLTPATLAGAGAETKVNAYLELASLRLDSEWVMSLADRRNKDMPPVSLVFAGSLSNAEEIAPTVDTAAIESYFTVRRMQEDVERLETLDVTGRTPPPTAEAAPPEDAAISTEPPPIEPSPPVEAAPLTRPAPRAEILPWGAAPQSGPPVEVAPSAEAMQMPVPNAEPEETVEPEATPAALLETSPPAPPAASPVDVPDPLPRETAEPDPPTARPAKLPEELPIETIDPDAPSEAASSEDQTTPAAAMVPAEPRQTVRPRRSGSSGRRVREAPDAWKKGIGIFGGG
jgi:hypothetical protein